MVLTELEKTVFDLSSKGDSLSDIASKLGMRLFQIDNALCRARKKLFVKGLSTVIVANNVQKGSKDDNI